MKPEQPNAIHFCRHEVERRRFSPNTLHQKMLIEAEPVVQHNWLDVAFHDYAKLSTIPVGHFCAWIICKTGSYLTPLYCQLSDAQHWQRDHVSSLAPIQCLFLRWHDQEILFEDNSAYANAVDRHCFIVVKTDTSGGGKIIPVEFAELADLAGSGRMRWTREGFRRVL